MKPTLIRIIQKETIFSRSFHYFLFIIKGNYKIQNNPNIKISVKPFLISPIMKLHSYKNNTKQTHNVPEDRSRHATSAWHCICMHGEWSPTPNLTQSLSISRPFYNLGSVQSPAQSVQSIYILRFFQLFIGIVIVPTVITRTEHLSALVNALHFSFINVFWIFHCFICACFPTNPTSFSSPDILVLGLFLQVQEKIRLRISLLWVFLFSCWFLPLGLLQENVWKRLFEVLPILFLSEPSEDLLSYVV